MGGIVRVVGEASGVADALADHLRAASFALEDGTTPRATLLVTMTQTADAAISAARDFGEAGHCAERLIVHAWHTPEAAEWEAKRQAAIMVAFTRHAAANWAGRRVRVNAVTMATAEDGAPILHGELAAALHAIWRWPSMTGQLIHLGTAWSRPGFLPRVP